MVKKTLKSEKEYDQLHQDKGFGEEREFYRMLSCLLQGKKSVDMVVVPG